MKQIASRLLTVLKLIGLVILFIFGECLVISEIPLALLEYIFSGHAFFSYRLVERILNSFSAVDIL